MGVYLGRIESIVIKRHHMPRNSIKQGVSKSQSTLLLLKKYFWKEYTEEVHMNNNTQFGL